LLDAYRTDVMRLLIASVGRVDADDCFQETFLAALRAYPRLRDPSNLKGWLLTIAHRKAMDHHRRRVRQRELAARLPAAATTTLPESDDTVWEPVRRLPPKQQAAIVYRYANDLSYGEIGRLLECSDEAARRNVHEGLKAIRESWHG
jgi:RNA polymerase sigma factor (sigma-70 family)